MARKEKCTSEPENEWQEGAVVDLSLERAFLVWKWRQVFDTRASKHYVQAVSFSATRSLNDLSGIGTHAFR